MDCSYCGTTAPVEYVCSGCFEAQYCSEDCGNAHWKHAAQCQGGDELIGKKEKWIQKAIKKPGALKRQAERAHKSLPAYEKSVEHDKRHRYSETTHRRVALAKTLSKFHHHHK